MADCTNMVQTFPEVVEDTVVDTGGGEVEEEGEEKKEGEEE